MSWTSNLDSVLSRMLTLYRTQSQAHRDYSEHWLVVARLPRQRRQRSSHPGLDRRQCSSVPTATTACQCPSVPSADLRGSQPPASSVPSRRRLRRARCCTPSSSQRHSRATIRTCLARVSQLGIVPLPFPRLCRFALAPSQLWHFAQRREHRSRDVLFQHRIDTSCFKRWTRRVTSSVVAGMDRSAGEHASQQRPDQGQAAVVRNAGRACSSPAAVPAACDFTSAEGLVRWMALTKMIGVLCLRFRLVYIRAPFGISLFVSLSLSLAMLCSALWISLDR